MRRGTISVGAVWAMLGLLDLAALGLAVLLFRVLLA